MPEPVGGAESRPEAAAEAARPAVRGAGAAGGVSVGRGAGAAAPCAMPGVPASVTPSLLRSGGGDGEAGRMRRAAQPGDNRTPWRRHAA